MATVASDEAIEVNHIIFSPPYSESMSKRRKGYTTHPELSKTRHMGLGSSDGNIGNLRHGKIDVVITSPPYSEGIGHGGGRAEVFKEEKHLYLRGKGSYSEGRGNIGHLKHGKIDIIVTSPPYEKSISKRGREEPRERVADRLRKAGFSEEYIKRYFTDNPSDNKMKGMGIQDAYSTDPNNIGNLPGGKVDSIITSPPYEGSLESTTRHTKGGIPGRDKKLGQTGFYPSENKNNIGSKKGETYLQAMFQIYAECLKTLKPGGKMILVLKDFVRNKKVVRLDLDTKRLCEAVGFRWVETKLFRLPRKSFWRVLYERKYPEVDTSLLRFEFVEIFEKPMGTCA